jgi:Domain of unknown function (DUF4785)
MDHRIILVVALACACSPTDARPLAPAQLGDLAPRRLLAPQEDEPPRATLVPLADARALPADTTLVERPRPHRTRSREYWFAASASELGGGVELPTTVDGAIVRLQPLDLETRAVAGIDPASLVLVDGDGGEHPAGAGMARLASWEQLRDAEVGLAAGTTAFAIDPALGHGAFVLRTGVEPMAPRYLVHVAERSSELVLAVEGDHDAALWGDAITVDVELEHGVAELSWAVASLRDPWGNTQPLELAAHGAGLRGSFVLDEQRPPRGALWTVEVDARVRTQEGTLAHRSGRTAFGYAVPSAGFVGELRTSTASRGGLEIALPLEIAARGRYAVGGTLWGRDALGRARPVALAQAAAWLETGTDELTLSFDDAVLSAAQASAPWELRDLRLVDQGRMAVLHRQAFAATLE